MAIVSRKLPPRCAVTTIIPALGGPCRTVVHSSSVKSLFPVIAAPSHSAGEYSRSQHNLAGRGARPANMPWLSLRPTWIDELALRIEADTKGTFREKGAPMASRFTELVVDGRDTRGLAEFWCDVLGYRIIDEDKDVIEIGTAELTAEEVVSGPVPPTIVFVPVPEDKAVKNRLHIDVSPIDRDPPEEVERLIGL